jgi:hypothetical protein
VRITVLLTRNADGTVEVPPLISGKSRNPCSLVNVRKLPTKCVANTKAEAAQAPSGYYLRAFSAKLRTKNIKILLLVDQHAVHSQNTSYITNANYMFFTPKLHQHSPNT